MQLVNHNATVDQTCSRKPNSSSVPKKNGENQRRQVYQKNVENHRMQVYQV